MAATRAPLTSEAAGALLAVAAYVFWGLVPPYFNLMAGIDPFELIGWRVASSLVFALILVAATRGWRPLAQAFRSGPTTLWLIAAGVAILVNWTTFAVGVLSGHVLETSLGYFLIPLVSILFGVLALGERLRPAQWVAVGVGLVAVIVMVVGYGSVPWIALLVAASFGGYGIIKKHVGPGIGALTGFTVETIVTVPLSLGMLWVAVSIGGLTIATASAGAVWAVVGFGAVTALPLLLFSAAARRVSLTTLGFAQYLTPSMSFVYGAFIMHEPMPPERWVGFGLVWLSLVILTADLVVAERRRRHAGSTAVEPAP